MKAQIYKTNSGYDVLTSSGKLYQIQTGGAKPNTTFCGIVGANFQPIGQRVKQIPTHIKILFFNLQKN